ncbi:MAG: hypothetical protein HY360_08720 [Verrucomicrobia bacterium]|nr:hypothetical protein [Verrucomicrobiota bacterium]
MDREEIERLQKDLDVVRQASGLTDAHPAADVRLLGLALIVFGVAFALFASWRPEWVPYGILVVIAVLFGGVVCLARAGFPNFSRREMIEMLTWLCSLLGVCLIFAIWGVLVDLPLRVLCGAEMFISSIFPLPVAIAARDSKAWICGIPLMAAGLALPFVPLPVGIMAGAGVVFSGICYHLVHWNHLQKADAPNETD